MGDSENTTPNMDVIRTKNYYCLTRGKRCASITETDIAISYRKTDEIPSTYYTTLLLALFPSKLS